MGCLLDKISVTQVFLPVLWHSPVTCHFNNDAQSVLVYVRPTVHNIKTDVAQ